MASPGGPSYWCYQCNRTVRQAGSGEDLVCPNCGDGFLEEMETPAEDVPAPPAPGFRPWSEADWGGEGAATAGADGQGDFYGLGQRSRGVPGNHPALAQLFEAMSSFFQQMQTNEAGLNAQAEGGARIRTGNDAGPVNPMLVFQAQMQNFLGGGNGGNIEFFFDTGTGTGPRRLPGNIGDYFWGPGLDQLIQQLAENDPNRYGAPPASKSAVEAMPNIYISQEHLGTDAAHCAVCKDEFELGTEVKQMPCKHMYHPDCILPWLAQHNSCPVCRYEMPTDDPDYDQTRARGQAFTGISGNPAAGETQGTGERAGAGSGGFTIWGIPGQLAMGRFAGGGEGRNDTAGQEARSNLQTSAGTSRPPQGGSSGGSAGGGGRRFPFNFPWMRSSITTSQSPANAQAESSGQANSAETVSSGPFGEGSDTPGQTSRARRSYDDGDTVTSETRHEDLD